MSGPGEYDQAAVLQEMSDSLRAKNSPPAPQQAQEDDASQTSVPGREAQGDAVQVVTADAAPDGGTPAPAQTPAAKRGPARQPAADKAAATRETPADKA